MPYVERVTKAGNTIEIERYFTSRYKKKGISRGDKVKPTKEEQEKVNTRQAERKLRIQSEETITLLAIENSKPHKDGLLFRICQYVKFKQKARRENEKL